MTKITCPSVDCEHLDDKYRCGLRVFLGSFGIDLAVKSFGVYLIIANDGRWKYRW